MTEAERAHWLAEAQSARPVDAWPAYLRAAAHDDALTEATRWLASKKAGDA